MQDAVGRAINLQEAIQKRPILLSQYWINEINENPVLNVVLKISNIRKNLTQYPNQIGVKNTTDPQPWSTIPKIRGFKLYCVSNGVTKGQSL